MKHDLESDDNDESYTGYGSIINSITTSYLSKVRMDYCYDSIAIVSIYQGE